MLLLRRIDITCQAFTFKFLLYEYGGCGVACFVQFVFCSAFFDVAAENTEVCGMGYERITRWKLLIEQVVSDAKHEGLVELIEGDRLTRRCLSDAQSGSCQGV